MKNYPTINRSILLVKPKQAFYDWSNSLFPTLTPTKAARIKDHNSYLLEDELFLDDPESELKNYWKPIFLQELYGQCTNEAKFPEISWNLFNQWFDYYQSSVVTDLTDAPLYTEHYE